MNLIYNTVIFDLDGTILNTLDDLAYSGNKTLSSMGLPVHDKDEYKHMVGNGIPKLVERMLPEQNRQKSTLELALKLFQTNYNKNKFNKTAPYPGICEMLQNLKQNNVRLAVLSNKSHEHVPTIINMYFNGLFDIALGLNEDFPAKPSPESANYIIQQLNADKSKTLYCGDSDVDIKTAKNSNLKSCGVLWGFRTKEELLFEGADYIAHNVNELNNIIFQ